jgi:hypothetical protein
MPFHLTPRLVMVLTICMACVSILSWTAARISPYALFAMPLFVVYCGMLLVIRNRVKAAYWVGQ